MFENQKLIDSLCGIHTNLSHRDIDKIKSVASQLDLIADLNQANVFIDCPTKEGKHAIVVAEAKPSTAHSVYKKQVVGKFAYEAFEPAVFFTLKTGKPMFLNRALTQEGKTVEQSVVPIKGKDGAIIGTLIMEKAVGEHMKIQEKTVSLSDATQTLSDILLGFTGDRSIISEVLEESLFFLDSHNNILYFNPSAQNLILEICSKECQIGTRIFHYLPSLEAVLSHPEELLMREVFIDNRVFQVKKIRLEQDNQTSGIFIILRDLTELREKERELIVKSVAIREIHHRVKNNLQTVASLLRLQMRRGIPEESKPHFVESLNRVLSIASVYELILANSNVDDVDIRDLTEKIGNMLVYTGEHSEIAITYSGPNIQIKSNKAVSLALIVNELIQNCVKHAFHSDEKGNIKVIFGQQGYTVHVMVIDDGRGYSPDAKQSLGLDIVRMMVEHDLAGRFTISRAEIGTIASVSFQVDKEVFENEAINGG